MIESKSIPLSSLILNFIVGRLKSVDSKSSGEIMVISVVKISHLVK